MKLSITSKTNVDSTLQDAQLVIEFNGREYVGQRLKLDKWNIYQEGGHSENMNDLIGSITYSKPIRHRVASEGRLDFFIEGLDISSNAHIPVHGDLTVTLIDDLGDKHIIAARDQLIRPGY
jgi:hypothetical protein